MDKTVLIHARHSDILFDGDIEKVREFKPTGRWQINVHNDVEHMCIELSFTIYHRVEVIVEERVPFYKLKRKVKKFETVTTDKVQWFDIDSLYISSYGEIQDCNSV